MAFQYFPLAREQLEARKDVWDGLAKGRPFGRAAIIFETAPDYEKIGKSLPPVDQIPLAGPAGDNPEWDAEIRNQVRRLQIVARSAYPNDLYPGICVARNIFGQSQALAEIFGCKLVPQETEPGLFFPVSWIESAGDLDSLKTVPMEKCLYNQALEFARYALEATAGELDIQNPVMTGPIDTANYVLGTTRLMEWVYQEPKALHRLLRIITDALIGVIQAFQKAVQGRFCPGGCLPRGIFGLCSEVRALISAEVCEEFEAPYLRQIGEACGLLAIHSCGSWERTLPSLLRDPHIRQINFQCREMDLAEVLKMTRGRLSISVGPSINLAERYTWPEIASFYRYVISTVAAPAPIELILDGTEEGLKAYQAVQQELKGGPCGLFCWKPEVEQMAGVQERIVAE